MASAAPTLPLALPILSSNGSSASSSSLATAAAKSLKEKPKRHRTGKPKVKTGCRSCKQRRIKCDERRPGCTQCVKSKKECPGYPAPPRSLRPHEVVVIAPRPTLAASLPVQRVPIPSVEFVPRRATKLAARRSIEQSPQPPQPPLPFRPRQHSVAEVPQSQAYFPPFYQPAPKLVLRGQEGLYFQLFRSHTARELSGFFDSVFWTQTVLRECHNEAAIRHAVIALGALYKTLEQSGASPPGSPSDRATRPSDPSNSPVHHWQVAVRQYSEAIKSVVALSSQGHGQHRILLMASVLLACFDSFIGDHKQAIYQIQTGLLLLDQVSAGRRRQPPLSSPPSTASPGPEHVEDELVQVFTRLAIQAKSYDMAFHFPQPYVIRLTPQSRPTHHRHHAGPEAVSASSPSGPGPSPPQTWRPRPAIPARFGTLLEARLAWDALCETMLRFTETLFAQATDDGPMGVLPRTLGRYGAGFGRELDAWSCAFRHILERRSEPGVSAQEKAGIAVLKMFQIMGQILFLMTFCDSESRFDAFEGCFRTIVDLALEVVGDEERRAAARRCPDPTACTHRNIEADFLSGRGGGGGGGAASHEYRAHHVKPSFSADLGIVPPLYVVATKCRNSAIRRQAVRLLRSSSRREGMWDSQLCGLIGEWVASIEEGGDGGWPGAVSSHQAPPPHGGSALGSGGEDEGGGWEGERREGGWVPADRRVMVRSVDFDLRARFARLSVGTRGIKSSAPDLRARKTSITW